MAAGAAASGPAISPRIMCVSTPATALRAESSTALQAGSLSWRAPDSVGGPQQDRTTDSGAMSYDSHFQSANCSRSLVLRNFPTEVRGISFTATKASGNCHLANLPARKARNSSGVAAAPSLKTTTASDRAWQVGWGTA